MHESHSYLLYSASLSDYPWRSAVQPLTSNVIKWFYMPDFAMRPNPSFIFCKLVFTVFPSLLTLNLFLLVSDSDSSSLSVSLQMTISCCSAHPCSGTCLRRRTGWLCDCWQETTSRSAVVWILVPLTSLFLSITFFTAGQKHQFAPQVFLMEFLSSTFSREVFVFILMEEPRFHFCYITYLFWSEC